MVQNENKSYPPLKLDLPLSQNVIYSKIQMYIFKIVFILC